MENLTHTLIGLMAAEVVAQSVPAADKGLPTGVRRGLFVTLAAVGGNLPDLDLVYSFRFGSGDKLTYMLQHRGYTHTVLGCLALALLLYLGAECWIRWRRLQPTSADRLALAGVALFGTLLHLAMDALNSYGVHPFWPLQNRWFYGDSVFIVEPLYWVAVAPLIFVVRSLAARWLLALVLVAAVAASAIANPWRLQWPLAFAIATLALIFVGKKATARTAALTSAGMMLCVTATFILAGRAAAARVETIASERFPTDRVIDHVLTPSPTNPLCWDVLLLETRADRYTVRHGVLSNAPGIISAQRCPDLSAARRTTAPLVAVAAPDSSEIHWLGEFGMSRQQLVALVATHCDAARLMQFARAPFATEFKGRPVIGDLRFDREPQLGMSELALENRSVGACVLTVPWIAPRADLLGVSATPAAHAQ